MLANQACLLLVDVFVRLCHYVCVSLIKYIFAEEVTETSIKVKDYKIITQDSDRAHKNVWLIQEGKSSIHESQQRQRLKSSKYKTLSAESTKT